MIGAEALFLDPPGQRASLLARIARVAFFTIVLLGFVAIGSYVTWRGFLPMRWRPTPCTIIASSVLIQRDREHAEHPYISNIEFRYFIGEKGIRNSKVEIDEKEMHYARAADAYRLVRAYPSGASATCYVNPADSSEAVLTRPWPWWQLSLLGAFAAFALVFLPFYAWSQFGPIRTAAKNPRADAIAGAIFMVGGVVWLAIGFAVPLVRMIESFRWTPAPCTIISKEILVQEAHGQHHVSMYRPDILYRYEFAGATYHSNDYNFTDYPGFWYSQGKRSILKCFDNPGTCYVNPADPSEAILTRHVGSSIALIIFPLAMVMGGFWPIFQYRNSPLRLNSREELSRRYERLQGIYVKIATIATAALAAVIANDIWRESRFNAVDAVIVFFFVLLIAGLCAVIAALIRVKFKV